jgi:hypothetical protein
MLPLPQVARVDILGEPSDDDSHLMMTLLHHQTPVLYLLISMAIVRYQQRHLGSDYNQYIILTTHQALRSPRCSAYFVRNR